MMITPEQERVLRQLVDVFLEENKKINLSALRTEDACWIGNVLDSVAALELSTFKGFSSIPQPLPPQEEGALPYQKKPVPPNILAYARSMRKNPTAAEEILWEALRYDQLSVRFRRQYPFSGLIFDFFSPKLKLVIEVDGSIHLQDPLLVNDKERDDFLTSEYDIETLRFTNEEVINALDSVLKKIAKHIQKHSPPPLEEALGVEENNKQEQEGVGAKILDIGTGGGFPLLPLAICLPQIQFTGLDSTKKKIDAVGRIVTALDLKNVTLVSGRAEAFGHDPAHRQHYDIVMTRAGGALNELLELMAPFTGVNGYCIAWKSLHIDEELKQSLPAQKELNYELVTKHEYDLPGDFGRRQLVVFQKKKVTPKAYPRAVGVPKKTPIS